MTMRHLGIAVAFAALVAGAPAAHADTVPRKAKSGVPAKISLAGRIDPMTCATDESVNVTPNVTRQPQHGTLAVKRETAKFHSVAGAHVCNDKPYTASVLYYTSAKGYHGADTVEVTSTQFSGRMSYEKKLTYEITVE